MLARDVLGKSFVGSAKMLIDESRLQKALTYLATTDEPADLRADVERAGVQS